MMKRVLLLLAILTPLQGILAGDDEASWSFLPISPTPPPSHASGCSPVDGFILQKLEEETLTPSPQADKRTLIRRAYVDLHGLPPTPEDVRDFLNDDDSLEPFARLTDRLLASPRLGERWARHWMDVVHFAETHGHDEDAIREHAWPYRDYLIQAFNSDLPYARFIEEQVAGDVLDPENPWATVATSFLACGPWDESSQMGIQDGTVDKEIARYLDRDDMLTTTMSTFTSTTVHCARCHDHKFDPVSIEDYYGLQAVFAGVDRVDRPYEADPEVGRRRQLLAEEKALLDQGQLPPGAIDHGETIQAVAEWARALLRGSRSWSVFPPHTVTTSSSATTTSILEDGSVLFGGEPPEKDTYHFTLRPGEQTVTAVLLEVLPHDSLPAGGPGLAENGNLHLCEIQIRVSGEKAVPIRSATADFDQAGWTIAHAIDGNPDSAWGIHPQQGKAHQAMFILEKPLRLAGNQSLTVVLEQNHGRRHLIGRARLALTAAETPRLGEVIDPAIKTICEKPPSARSETERKTLTLRYLNERNERARAALPEPLQVYAVSSKFEAIGNFKPALKPRPVFVLKRGNIHTPGSPAQPEALTQLDFKHAAFPGGSDPDEGARRAALAQWLSHPDNPLTWRSIVNRVWHYHFGRGIVSTPNDFGEMGARPTHPALLDWLATAFRDHEGSFKWLHRTIMTSATYQQSADESDAGLEHDPENRWLWRRSPRRLEAEAIRDAVLQFSGLLDLTMGGPSARQFHTSKGVHITPVVDYLNFDPDDRANFRRSVYRFVFRTVPDPLMQALDCPDASQLSPKRTTSATPLQALALLNNPFFIRQSQHLAERLQRRQTGSEDATPVIESLFHLIYNRPPSAEEASEVSAYAEAHGLANACRVLLNSNAFVYVR